MRPACGPLVGAWARTIAALKHPSNHIFEHTPESLGAWCESVGMPKFRAKQILEWVYQKGIADPALMTSLSKRDRDVLASQMTFLSGSIVRRQSATDGVEKLLIEWTDGSTTAPQQDSEGTSLPLLSGGAALGDTSRQTECVMIPSEDRRTACISSQVGCPVGCRFCASGLGGLEGNLSAGRIVEQVWRLGDAIRESGSEEGQAAGPLAVRGSKSRITNVVFMGMGEPLANFGAVTNAIRTICSLWGLGISARKVTISTVGLPQAIERLAEQFELPVTLALSLHAPNDAVRRQLIPWAEYTTIKDLLAACQKWFAKTGREITLEYTLLRGVNDRPEHAAELSQVAKTLRANINLIRYNEVEGLPFKRPRTDDVREFQELLRARGVNSHIRASRGRDIAAACGQLRHEAKSAGAGPS